MSKQYIVKVVSELKPGESIVVSRHVMRELQNTSELANALSSFLMLATDPIDMVMEQIVGSSYSIESWIDQRTGNVHFKRIDYELPDGYRTYVSPDRRDMYQQEGKWWKYKEPQLKEVTHAKTR